MILYHYTSLYHLKQILDDGFLKTTESNGSMLVSHYCKDVVWLTINKNPESEISLVSMVDKKQVRFTVSVEAIPYKKWVKKNKVDLKWFNILNETGGNNSDKWYVVEKPILKKSWLKIEVYNYDLNEWEEIKK